MLEEFKTITVPIELDALELLDRNADAKALHGAGLWPPLRVRFLEGYNFIFTGVSSSMTVPIPEGRLRISGC